MLRRSQTNHFYVGAHYFYFKQTPIEKTCNETSNVSKRNFKSELICLSKVFIIENDATGTKNINCKLLIDIARFCVLNDIVGASCASQEDNDTKHQSRSGNNKIPSLRSIGTVFRSKLRCAYRRNLKETNVQ